NIIVGNIATGIVPYGGGIACQPDTLDTLIFDYNDVWGNLPNNYYACRPGPHAFSLDPLFVSGPAGEYYLSQIAAGQPEESPCVDAGDTLLMTSPLNLDSLIHRWTTRSDTVYDAGRIDLGYHYRPTPPSNDVACTQILVPMGIIDSSSSLTPACSVYNYGTAYANYTVRMRIGNFLTITTSVSNHTPGTKIYVTFPSVNANWPRGSHTVTCSTELSGDFNPENDKVTGSVFVRYLDAQCLSVDAPTGVVNRGTTIQPRATIRNNGNTTQDITARLIINDGSGYSQTITQSLTPGQQLQYTFSNWTANNLGLWTVKCTTELSGDMNSANDKQEGEVFVRFLDVGVIRIIAPTDTVDSGAVLTPQAVVKNFGNEAVTFDVTFYIEGPGKWNSTKPVENLNPQEERVIVFDFWCAERVGTFTTKCTTQLSGDGNGNNDQSEGEVFVKGGISPFGWFKVAEVPLEPDQKRIKSGGGMTRCGNHLYILKGNNTQSLYRYSPNEPTALLENMVPLGTGKKVKKGGALTSDGERFLYLTKGSNTREFWRYDTQNKVWDSLPSVPIGKGKNLKGGTGLIYLNHSIYLLKGSKTNEFYRFDCATGQWDTTLKNPPGDKGYGDGSCLVAYDNNTLYALRGKYNEFYKYEILANLWEKDSAMPFLHPFWNKKKKVGEGAALARKGNKIYAFKGNNTKEFWSFDPMTKWTGLETIPKVPDRKYVKSGGALCTWIDGTIYALKGNNTNSIWKYAERDLPLTLALPNLGVEELNGETFTRSLFASPKEELSKSRWISSNPTKGLTEIHYNLGEKGVVTLRIYDAFGNLVYFAKDDKGESVIKNLPAGVYFLHFERPIFDEISSPRDQRSYKEKKKLILVK
ncbi:MAG: T9SS type A sorting domain-containing protein, partial [candidate division WOR-3 bacterium]